MNNDVQNEMSGMCEILQFVEYHEEDFQNVKIYFVLHFVIERRRQLKLSFQTQGNNLSFANSTNSSLSNSMGATACPPM